MENTGSAEDKTPPTSHDQNFKNLIIDYPEDSLEFFAEPEAADIKGRAQIIPIRQEQLKERLGDRFRELDTPLLVDWPDRIRELILFVIEEETDPGRFSIHRLARYCLDLSEMFKTRRVVPVVIFLHPGNFEEYLRLQGDAETYLHFRFIASHLKRIPAADHMNSTNVVARINLPNMAYDPKDRVEVYASAQEGLMVLEKDPEKQLKYVDFIDFYMNLTDEELKRYRQEYLSPIKLEEGVMGLRQMLYEEGRINGIDEGRLKGINEGRLKGIDEGRLKGIDEGIDEGITRGLHRGIKSLLKVKFGDEGLKLMERIIKIKDPSKLEEIMDIIELMSNGNLRDFQKRID